ncbi:transcriptional regulator [Haladaptatus paucihalophilus DX253]|uniref:Transcriptional regulator n=1 Tax=Haladaptatus paucihalophilus DX253 TaxID=797209 RepID=E7QPB9_HALPU|nr:IclR family transcriptional regulator [Haladaptatus paucihalophilus]EFW94035.1 transcriptional regulator [Haladaptatus paucihalophilus DX253]SHK63834.1 transcriptional regulator, IclR family [Haladaptatus paucihalophilus DX253]
MSSQSPKIVEATTHSFEILETLVEADRPMGVTELSNAVGLSKGVTYNHLGTLSELGYVRKENRKYCPSLRLLSPGEQTRSNHEAYRVARSHVDNLATTTGEVVTLLVEEDGLGICTYMAGTDIWSPDYVCGDAFPLHVSAPGKAILAALETDRIDEIVARHGLPSVTDHTISDRQSLETELRSIRDKGIAFSREEQFEGVVGIGISFGLDERAPAAAIGICGPRGQLSGRYLQEDITGQVISTAKSIQVELRK